MEALLIVSGIVGALAALNLAIWRWGQDSTDTPGSPEWERRRLWRGYGTG
jgi:hypothetical protein